MCRFTLSYLNQTSLKKVLPLNNVLAIHIYLGYIVIGLSLMVTIIFLAYYGILCEDEGTGDDDNADGTNYCHKVSTEIFLTGIAMMILLFVIGAVSLVRDLIPYEIFRMVHHLTLIVYGLAVLHTLDFQVYNTDLM
jgi:predicted ferric reductase